MVTVGYAGGNDENGALSGKDRLRLLSALRGSALFGRASAHLFHDLLGGVSVRTLAHGDRLGEDEDFFFAVLSGRLNVYEKVGGQRRLLDALGPGDLHGEAHLFRGESHDHEVVADAPSRVAVVTASGLARLPAHLHAELQRTSHELEGHRHNFALCPKEPTLVYVSTPEGVDGPTVDALCVQLAMAIERQFSETVVVVGRHPKGWQRLPAPPDPVPKPKKPPKVPPTWRAALQDAAPDYLIVSLGEERRPHGRAEVEAEPAPGTFVTLAKPGVDTHLGAGKVDDCLSTVLLDPSAPRKTNKRTLELFGYDEGRNRSCRLMLGPGALARARAAGTEAARAAFADEYADTLGRWARFVTRRSVAVALGGGGAWGYFHVALLKKMLAAGVPVDITSGTSFGSLVSVYFAALGEAGLDTLVQRGSSFVITQTLSMVTTSPLEHQIAADLDNADLTRLPIAANPFTTNLTKVEGQAAFAGPAALGARASSSAPGVFGPTVLPGRGVFVDGVVAGNVPGAILIAQGADMLVASNVIPKPAPKPVPKWAPARWLSTVSPIDRVYEGYLAAMFFLYAQGLEQGELGCVAVQGNDALESMPDMPTPSDFGRAKSIVSHAMQHESVDAAVEAIVREWSRRRRARSA